MDTSTLLSVIGGLIILAFITIALLIRMKSKPSTFDKESAANFLEGLKDVFYKKMMEIVSSFDVTEYTSLEEFESSILSEIYDAMWEYVSAQLEEASKTDIITAMSLKVLNKEFVNNFLNTVIKDTDIESKINSLWNEKFKETCKYAAEEDKSLQEKYSDDKDYVENSDNIELEPAKQVEPTEQELKSLNPPTDDEQPLDPESDPSVEVIEEDTFVDSNGRVRDKLTGRFVSSK